MFCPTNDNQLIKLSDITAFVCKLDVVTPIKSTNQNSSILDFFININAAITKKIWDTAKDLEKDGTLPKDDCRRAEKGVQDLTDEFVGRIEALTGQKEKEVLEV